MHVPSPRQRRRKADNAVRLALSEISTANATFAEDVAAYAGAGFDAIGLWEFKLPADDSANLELLLAHGLTVASCVPSVPSILQLGIPGMEGPPDPEERIEAICASVRRLARYEPESVLCVAGPAAAGDVDDARQIVVSGLRRIAAAARENGVRLGFEPIHASQHDSTSFVNTLEDALALLDEAGLDDVGIMADTFNLRDEPPGRLAANVARITGVHVADAAPAGGSPDERVLPAPDGPSAHLVAELRSAGWDGSLEIEIFSTPDAFWRLPPDEAARLAYAAVSRLAG